MREHLGSISPQVPQFEPCSVVSMILCASLVAGIARVGPAIAQTTLGLQPFNGMGVTSPLAAHSTQSAEIPLGSTEIATPGISPLVSEQSALTTTACAAPYGGDSSAAPFDGAAISSATSLSCAENRNTSSPLRSPLSIGRAEVPLGATEIGGAGISLAEPVAGPHLPSSARPANSPPTIADPRDR